MFTEVQEPLSEAPARSLSIAQSLVHAAWHRRRMVSAIACFIVLCTTIIALALPNLYSSTAVLLPPQQSGSTSAAMLAQLGALGAMASLGGGGGVGGALGLKNPNDLQVSLLKSHSVEDALIARFHLQDLYHRHYLSAARRSWEKHTSIDNGIKDGLLRLSVTDRDPRRAAELANGWVDEYKRFSATLAVTEASQRRLFFEHELDHAHADLTRAEDNLEQTQQRTGLIEVDSQSRAMITAAAMLRGQVAAKQVEVRGMHAFAADGNPDLARAEQELATMQAQLAAMDVDSDRKEGDLVAPKGRLTEAGLEYTRALREAKFREAIVEALSRQYEMARVDEAKQGSMIQVVDPAQVPDRPSSLYKWWVFAGGMIAALPLALVIAWIAEAIAVARSWRLQMGSWNKAFQTIWSNAR